MSIIQWFKRLFSFELTLDLPTLEMEEFLIETAEQVPFILKNGRYLAQAPIPAELWAPGAWLLMEGRCFTAHNRLYRINRVYLDQACIQVEEISDYT